MSSGLSKVEFWNSKCIQVRKPFQYTCNNNSINLRKWIFETGHTCQVKVKFIYLVKDIVEYDGLVN